jgi:ABC-2 type transport system permease protein
VLTDVPLGAVGAAVLLLILMGILDQIDALGDLRRFLPTHYSNSWVDALGETILWNDMAIGASYAVAFFAVFVAIAVLRFDRKDITS